MEFETLINLLESKKNSIDPPYRVRWSEESVNLPSFGIGITQLRKIARNLRPNHVLAEKLWEYELFETKALALLVDDPLLVTWETIEKKLNDVHINLFSHILVGYDSTVSKVSFADELASVWVESKDSVRRRCSYILVGELAKNSLKKKLPNTFFLSFINRIEDDIHDEQSEIQEAMLNALINIGKRNIPLNAAAIRAIKLIGNVYIDYGDSQCKPPQVLGHLTSEHLQTKLIKQHEEEIRYALSFSG